MLWYFINIIWLWHYICFKYLGHKFGLFPHVQGVDVFFSKLYPTHKDLRFFFLVNYHMLSFLKNSKDYWSYKIEILCFKRLTSFLLLGYEKSKNEINRKKRGKSLVFTCDPYEVTFCPSILNSMKWLYLKTHMLLVKEKCKCIFKC
jgi:hypothetical protein